MFSKQLVHILFGIITLLSVFFGFSIYSNYQNNKQEKNEIKNLILKFEQKFKTDSVYLANSNQLLIDKISQRILDSVSNVYQKKLELAVNQANKYKKILIANNIDITNINKKKATKNIAILNSPIKNPSNKTSPSAITYTQIDNNKTKYYKSSSNVTTYSKIAKSQNETNTTNNISNVTTYSKLPFNSLDNKNLEVSITSNKIIHNNYMLDTAKNINAIDNVPIYPGCENNTTENDKKRCFAIKIHKHILSTFNSKKFNDPEIKNGLNKIRVLFVINEDGNAKIGKLVGDWPHATYLKIKNAVESTPKMKPGFSNNRPISVKYSLLIPFIKAS